MKKNIVCGSFKKIALFYLIVVFSVCFEITALAEVSNGSGTANYSGASAALQTVEAGNEIPNIALGNKYFINGDYNKAISYYEQELNTNSAIAYYNKGVAEYMLGRVQDAEKDFRSALKYEPGFDNARINLAVCLTQIGKTNEAEQVLLDVSPEHTNSLLYTELGNVNLARGDMGKASYYYSEALAKNPTNQYILKNYANFLIAAGDLNKSIEILEGISDKDFSVYYNLAYAYNLLGDKDNSVLYAKQALNFYDNNVYYFDNLAKILHELREFGSEVDALERVNAIHQTLNSRYRLANAYYLNEQFKNATNEIEDVLKDEPNNIDAIILKYRILIVTHYNNDAGEFIDDSYARLKNDRLLYYTVRHRIRFVGKNDSVDPYLGVITSNRTSDYLNLVRAIYYDFKGENDKERSYFDNITTTSIPEYGMFSVYMSLRDKNYGQALEAAKYIDVGDPEYFWYQFMVDWDNKRAKELDRLTKRYYNSAFVSVRKPRLAFSIQPVITDMDYKYRFLPNSIYISKTLMYPLFINPNEMSVFINISNNLMEQKEYGIVSTELDKATILSDAIRYNNIGVQYFLAYAYKDALKNFLAAYKLNSKNSYILFNIGLSYMVLGDGLNANKFFKLAMQINRYMIPAYLGSAVMELERGVVALSRTLIDNGVSAYTAYDANATSSGAGDGATSMPIDIKNYVFLLLIAKKDFVTYQSFIQEPAFALSENGNLRAINQFAQYVRTNDQRYLVFTEEVKKMYRGTALLALIKSYDAKSDKIFQMTSSVDKVVRFNQKYIEQVIMRNVPERYMGEYQTDGVALVENAYYNIYLGNRNNAFYYLRKMSDLNFQFYDLYKATLYYYLWQQDMINAEASRGSIINLGYTDRFVSLYNMYYLLMQNDMKTLNETATEYDGAYGTDFKLNIIQSLISLNDFDVENYMKVIEAVRIETGDIFYENPIKIGVKKY